MLEASVKVVNPLGLHARAASQLVRLAGKFKSSIHVSRPDRNITANAKSILSLLTLAAAIGTSLVVFIDGEDENEALNEIELLFVSGFGEISR